MTRCSQAMTRCKHTEHHRHTFAMSIQLSLKFHLDCGNASKRPSRDDWKTPEQILEVVRKTFAQGRIVTDPCTTEDNPTKAQKIFTSKENGLNYGWEGNAFINPPYSDPSVWIDTAADRVTFGEIEEAIVLVPAQSLGSKRSGLPSKTAQALCLWRGRIHFINPETGKPAKQTNFTSAFLYWGDRSRQFEEVFSQYGIVGLISK